MEYDYVVIMEGDIGSRVARRAAAVTYSLWGEKQAVHRTPTSGRSGALTRSLAYVKQPGSTNEGPSHAAGTANTIVVSTKTIRIRLSQRAAGGGGMHAN